MNQQRKKQRTRTDGCIHDYFFLDNSVARTIFIFNRFPMSSRSTRFCTGTALSILTRAVGSVWSLINALSDSSICSAATGVLLIAYCKSAVTEIVSGCFTLWLL